MNRLHDVFLNKILAMIFCLLLAATPAFAGHFMQPAFISNFYICNNLIQKGTSQQPDAVLYAIRANAPNEAVLLVVDLVGNKGVHNLEVELLDMNGNQIPIALKFNAWTAPDDDSIGRLTNRIAGSFPTGGIFFKVYDSLDNGNKTLLGIFRMMTVQVDQPAAPAAAKSNEAPQKPAKTKAK